MKNQKNKNRNLKMILTVTAFFAVIIAAHAQITPPGGGGVDDTTPAPIDGLIGLAMLAGAYFGGKKIRGDKKGE